MLSDIDLMIFTTATEAVTTLVGKVLRTALVGAVQQGITLESTVTVVCAVLRNQLRALEAR